MSASHLLGLKGPQQTPARVVEINILDDVKSIATDLSWALFFTRQQMVIKKLITPFINDSWIDKPAWERRRWNALWLHLPNGPEDLLYYTTNQQAITLNWWPKYATLECLWRQKVGFTSIRESLFWPPDGSRVRNQTGAKAIPSPNSQMTCPMMVQFPKL